MNELTWHQWHYVATVVLINDCSVACHVRSTSPLTLDCPADDMDRYFTLRYVTDDPAIGTLFLIDFRGINPLSLLTTFERSKQVLNIGTIIQKSN